jgi:hypothetical protein
MQFRTNGSGSITAGGGWQLQLTEFAADRLQARPELFAALPVSISKSLQQMHVDGMFSLAGSVHCGRDDRAAPLESGWDLLLNIEQGRFSTGVPVEAIFGQIDLHGGGQGERMWTSGQLQLDSLIIQRAQLTKLHGPLWMDAKRLILGRSVSPRSANQVREPIVATVYGGQLSADVEVALGDVPEFTLQTNLTNADMSTMARDWRVGQGNLTGQAFLELFLNGSARGRHTLQGHGTAQLRNANLYELPLVLALIDRLRSGRTGAAFNASDIAFRVSDDYVYFDRFDLTGDTITLKGVGEMSLDRQLRLDFYSLMGKEQLWSPLVRPFLGEASRQFLLIHVDGTLSNPRTTQEMLPGLNETLQQLFPELTPAPIDPR